MIANYNLITHDPKHPSKNDTWSVNLVIKI